MKTIQCGSGGNEIFRAHTFVDVVQFDFFDNRERVWEGKHNSRP